MEYIFIKLKRSNTIDNWNDHDANFDNDTTTEISTMESNSNIPTFYIKGNWVLLLIISLIEMKYLCGAKNM